MPSCSGIRAGWLLVALGCVALGSAGQGQPKNCADVLARIEKQLVAKGEAAPVLKIVPKGLAAGERVVGSCENGTQRIVERSRPTSVTEAASTAAGGRH